jgi:hypothetical protein
MRGWLFMVKKRLTPKLGYRGWRQQGLAFSISADPSKGLRAMSEVSLVENLRYDDFQRLPK